MHAWSSDDELCADARYANALVETADALCDAPPIDPALFDAYDDAARRDDAVRRAWAHVHAVFGERDARAAANGRGAHYLDEHAPAWRSADALGVLLSRRVAVPRVYDAYADRIRRGLVDVDDDTLRSAACVGAVALAAAVVERRAFERDMFGDALRDLVVHAPTTTSDERARYDAFERVLYATATRSNVARGAFVRCATAVAALHVAVSHYTAPRARTTALRALGGLCAPQRRTCASCVWVRRCALSSAVAHGDAELLAAMTHDNPLMNFSYAMACATTELVEHCSRDAAIENVARLWSLTRTRSRGHAFRASPAHALAANVIVAVTVLARATEHASLAWSVRDAHALRALLDTMLGDATTALERAVVRAHVDKCATAMAVYAFDSPHVVDFARVVADAVDGIDE